MRISQISQHTACFDHAQYPKHGCPFGNSYIQDQEPGCSKIQEINSERVYGYQPESTIDKTQPDSL